MKTSTKAFFAFIAAVIVAGILYTGLHSNQVSVGASAVGTTNSTQRISQIVANNSSNSTYVSGAAGSGVYIMASLTNSDANDRVITSIDFFFDGLATVSTSTSALTLKAATSSDTTSLNGNANLALSTTVATSTAVLFVGSTTPGLTSTSANRIWAVGSNLNFVSNATTSGNLIIKVNYIAE